MIDSSTNIREIILIVLLNVILSASVYAQDSLEIRITSHINYCKTDTNLTLDVYQPSNHNGAAILFVNSGGFHSPFVPKQFHQVENKNSFIKKDEFNNPDFMQQFSFQSLLKAGYIVFDLRHSNSQNCKLDHIVSDCESALNYLIVNYSRFNIDKSKIGIWGASAGAALAAHLGFKFYNKVNCLVLYYPGGYNYNKYSELIRMLPALQIETELLERLSLKNIISDSSPPTLILLGELDSEFIIEPSRKIYEDLLKYNVKTKIINYPRVGHIWKDKNQKFSKDISDDAMERLTIWFNTHLN